VYGLALQALGMGKIESNLLPKSIARSREWATKGRYFIIAACLLLAVSIMSFGRTFWDKMQYSKKHRERSSLNTRITEYVNNEKDYKAIYSQIDELKSSEKKAFKAFDYRDIPMQIIQAINAALPNEKNNPSQAQLYRAYEQGDARKAKEIDRDKRKQIFITNMDIQFSTDLENDQFRVIDFTQQSLDFSGEGVVDTKALEDEMAMRESMQMGYYGEEPIAAPAKKCGFLITIVGYSPYGRTFNDVRGLLNPNDVGNNRDKWGFLNRLEYMDELFEGNSPFKLFDKINPKHIQLEIKPVDTDGKCPVGTGMEKEKTYSTALSFGGSEFGGYTKSASPLVDPLTEETISAIKDENNNTIKYENDHWFILKIKFLWENAPELPENLKGFGGMDTYPTGY
jgi:hypothetical protein